jgi:hypothetical protein
MKFKFSIKTEFQLTPDIVEEKINRYFKKNYYRITDRGPGYIIFIDDEYADRKRPRSDFHTRIGEGKFVFHAADQGTFVKLIYLTDVLYPAFLMTLFAAFGAYIKSLGPILISFALMLPILYKIYYLKEHVFDDILEC